MNDVVDNQQKQNFRKAFRPTSALAKTVKFRDEIMEVHLTDGRIIGVPIIWFPGSIRHQMNKENIMRLGEAARVCIGMK